MNDDPIQLVKELREKAWQSTRYHRNPATNRSPTPREEHICWRAAEKIEELFRGDGEMVPMRSVREIFTRCLNLHNDQRAYSWHEIQDTLEEVKRAAMRRKDSPTEGFR